MTASATPATTTNGRRKGRVPKTFDDLRASVDSKDGITRVSMGRLRDLNKSGKLGIHVVNQITRQLAARNMEILLPAGQTEVPRYQDDAVVIFATDSKCGEIIRAVRRADTSTVNVLRNVAGDDSLEKLEQVAELVTDLQAVLDD